MSINIDLLKNTVNICYLNFLDYYQLVYKQTENLISLWNDSKNEKLFLAIKKQEITVNELHVKNSSEIEWYICQQHPTANNLRFFLTVLTSLKDLERCGDYVFSLAKIIYKNLENIKEFFEEVNICLYMQTVISKMWNIFEEKHGKINKKDLLKIQDIKKEFHQNFKIIFKKINVNLIKNLIGLIDQTTDNDANNPEVSNIYLILIKIDRLVDHVFNVAENFFLIDNPYNKESDNILQH